MTMNLCLVLDSSLASHKAETIWRDACEVSGDTLEIVNAANNRYHPLVGQLHLNTFPALLQGNQVLAVGIPTPEDAQKLLTELANTRHH
jgi:hypothetical protein